MDIQYHFHHEFYQRCKWGSLHLWSLAVEEQFYLIWPGLFVLFRCGRNLQTATWLLAIPICLAPVARVVAYLDAAPPLWHFLFSYYSFFRFADSLALGCLCAFLLARKREMVIRAVLTRTSWVAFAAVGLVVIPQILNREMLSASISVPFGYTLQGIGLALLLLQSLVIPQRGFYGVLNFRPIAFFGVLSYSVYLWQELIIGLPTVISVRNAWFLSHPWWLVSVLIVSLASFYALEKPIFKLRARFH